MSFLFERLKGANMVRIAGVDIKENKRVDIALTTIYGIGRRNVYQLVNKAGVDPDRLVKDLSKEELSKIHKTIETSVKVEGDLKQEIAGNISRLKAIGAYRGLRHSKNLPVRGQRTRSNARTKRGKRKTVGAMKKETRAKMEKQSRVK